MNFAKNFVKSVLCCTALSVLSLSPVYAADYPNRSIKLIVPFGPGGITDIIARQVAKGLSEKLGQSVVIENKPSAGHIVALQTVARAKPDGYTILLGSNTGFTSTPHRYKNLDFDVNSFPVIAPINISPTVLLARPEFPADSMTDFVKLAKSKPGVLNYGSFGVGTSAHLGMEIFKKDTGIEVTHVPYKGDAPGIMALLSKEVDVVFNTLFSAQERIRSGEVKALGVLQADRLVKYPSIQTMVEAGSKNADMPVWIAFFASPGTPKEIVKILGDATRSVVSSAEFDEFLEKRGNIPMALSNEELLEFIRVQSDRIGPIVGSLGLQAD
ncbi:MAG TPA: tripartite tricarboxylate transporter substrate binding protein [Eoetvoesiella sp.]